VNTKTELQQRIEKLESETASLKAELAKCDCADGIEQEKCWHAINGEEQVITLTPNTKTSLRNQWPCAKHAYGKMCDGTCGDPMCVVAYNRKITTYCGGCVQLRDDLAAAQREIAAYKQAVCDFYTEDASGWLQDRVAELLKEGRK